MDVYVFDTGIKRDHPSLEDRASFGIDFTGQGSGDQHGHGIQLIWFVMCRINLVQEPLLQV